MRTYRLGEKYTVTMIRERIKSKEKLMDNPPLFLLRGYNHIHLTHIILNSSQKHKETGGR
jgi:hypothetical protein